MTPLLIGLRTAVRNYAVPGSAAFLRLRLSVHGGRMAWQVATFNRLLRVFGEVS